MSNNNEGFLNKKVALVGGVIGIVVSCLAVFTFFTGITSFNLLTNKRQANSQQDTAEPQSAPIFTTAPEILINELEPTPRGIRNPSGIIPAGEIIIVDDFSLVVKPSFKIDEGWEGETLIYIEIVVSNISNRSRLFSYDRPQSLSMKDNLGNSFRPFDNSSDFYQSFQFSFDSGATVTFESAYNAHGKLQIPVFEGEIASGASQLIVSFDGFGSFTGFEISIDL
jgi:hypothetical protein